MADLASMAADVAAKFGIPTNIFSSLITKESGFNPNAVGAAGEIGITQVMPATATAMGFDPNSLKDPLTGMTAGATYLAQQYKKFGNWNDALAAYNAGPGNIAAGQPYASAVLGAAGVTGASAPGVQAAATGVPGVSSANVPAAASGSKVWYYAVAILIILILVVFGVWGTVKS